MVMFQKDELEVVGMYPDVNGRSVEKLNTPITPKENFLRLLQGEKPLWIPMDGDVIRLTPAIVPDHRARGFVMEAQSFDPNREGGGPDMFGVEWEWVPKAGGSMVRPGNPKVKNIAEWETDIVFPELDRWPWEASAEANRMFIDQEERLVGITIMNGLFERLVSFTDMGEAMISLVDEECQEGVKRLFDRLADFYLDMIGRFRQYFRMDLLVFHDDWGSQRAPLFSLETCREMVVPYLKRIVDGAHSMGVAFELHSCGKNELLVPAMVEAGVDLWNGQEVNDKKLLCDRYGDHMLFGAAPADLTPESSPEEVRASYQRFVEEFQGYRIYGGMARGVSAGRRVCYELSRVALFKEQGREE